MLLGPEIGSCPVFSVFLGSAGIFRNTPHLKHTAPRFSLARTGACVHL